MFLYYPGLDATNNVSQRAIRALIGARKNWGSNRTPRAARAQAVLTSILQTAKQLGTKPFDVLLELLGSSDQHKPPHPFESNWDLPAYFPILPIRGVILGA